MPKAPVLSFSPRPWTALLRPDGSVELRDANGMAIAVLDGYATTAERQANADLILEKVNGGI